MPWFSLNSQINREKIPARAVGFLGHLRYLTILRKFEGFLSKIGRVSIGDFSSFLSASQMTSKFLTILLTTVVQPRTYNRVVRTGKLEISILGSELLNLCRE